MGSLDHMSGQIFFPFNCSFYQKLLFGDAENAFWPKNQAAFLAFKFTALSCNQLNVTQTISQCVRCSTVLLFSTDSVHWMHFLNATR